MGDLNTGAARGMVMAMTMAAAVGATAACFLCAGHGAKDTQTLTRPLEADFSPTEWLMHFPEVTQLKKARGSTAVHTQVV